jgi:hypothetical protein
MCDLSDAANFAASLSTLFLSLAQFQFFVFCCYVIHRMIRRILR